MEKSDLWLSRAEEEAFNIEARKFNLQFLSQIDTDMYLSAFVHVHRRHNPLIPPWAVGCGASNFVTLVTQQWDAQAAKQVNPRDANEKRAMVIGAARRICSLPLQMDRESPHDDTYVSTALRRGLLYHVRDHIPFVNTYAIHRYDGSDAATRLEGADVLSILAHLFATLRCERPAFVNIPLLRYEPYERPAPPKVGKFGSPDRRLCSDLAYTAFHARAGRYGDRDVFRMPYNLLGAQGEGTITSFTKEDFLRQSHLNDAKNPLKIAMSTMAGKLLELEALGRDVSCRTGRYRCERQPFTIFVGKLPV